MARKNVEPGRGRTPHTGGGGGKRPPKTPIDPATRAQRQFGDLLGPSAEGINWFAKDIFGPGTGGRVDTGFDDNGNRLGENQKIIDMYKDLALKYADPQAARTIEMKDALEGAKQKAERSQEMRDAVERMKGGLEGYNSQENQAMREQGQREMDRNLAGATSGLAQAQARSRVRGAAAAAQNANLQMGDVEGRRRAEQDLFIKNADEKNRRLNEYGNFLGGQENSERAAQLAYAGMLGGQEKEEYGRTRDSTDAYRGALGDMRADELNRAMINMGRQDSEKAGYLGATFGGANIVLARQGMQQDYDINKKMIGLAGGTGRGGGDGRVHGYGGRGPDGATGGNQAFYDAAGQLIKNQTRRSRVRARPE